MNQQIDTYQHNAPALPDTEVTEDGLGLLQRQAEAMGAAHKLASVLCNTQMVPQTFRGKPDDGAAAILYGAELGLKPQQALQQVFVVHGQPAIYARTMVALLKAKGYKFETLEDTPESVTVRATSPRGETETSTWTIERATKAGYTSNKKYQSDPQGMLYAKCSAEVSRKIAPDVLLGIKYSAEDLELEQRPVKATATRTDRPQRGGAGVMSALSRAKDPEPETPAQETDWIALIEQAEDHDALNLVMNQAQQANLPDAEYEQMATAANARWEALSATAPQEGDK